MGVPIRTVLLEPPATTGTKALAATSIWTAAEDDTPDD